MNTDTLVKMGKKAFFQSIHPMVPREQRRAVIFGLDTEYIPQLDKASRFISWQLASADKACLSTVRPTLESLYRQSLLFMNQQEREEATVLVYVSYFSLAEIQFFDLADWQVSEYKGKYRLTQRHDFRTLMIVDLMDWFNPPVPLKDAAQMWGLKKLDFKIGERTEAIAKAELDGTNVFGVAELLADPEFYDYAINDAVLAQRIYTRMRAFFLGYGVDIVNTMTIAQTSACMFRQRIPEVIEQRDSGLRKMALSACWGGRMELLTRGAKENVYEYDATGQHPNSAIALGKLPREKDWLHATNLRGWLSGISGVGQVHFQFPENERYPCLPVFHKDLLLFPLAGVSSCTVSEVRQALDEGASVLLMNGWYYKDGTTVLTEYLKELQAERNKATDDAYRNLLKLLCNSIIGKFFQKSMGVDMAKVQAYASEHRIPLEAAAAVEGVDFGQGKITVGSCFYPEWYALALGYARASITKVARQHNALVISSDSFVTEEHIEPEEFTQDGIAYRPKAHGQYVGYRARFYRVGDKLAHHAVHNRDFSKEILAYYQTVIAAGYVHRRILHLKESWAVHKPFGANIERKMTVYLSYDWKRRLLEDGLTTVPWRDTEEFDAFLLSHKDEWALLKKDWEEISKENVENG
jgi:hypothetical protein